MAETEDKIKQMEKEMDRFEAEIAHQTSAKSFTTSISGGFTFPSVNTFIPHQLRVNPHPHNAIPAVYPILPMPPAVSMYISPAQSAHLSLNVTNATTTTNHMYSLNNCTTVHSSSSESDMRVRSNAAKDSTAQTNTTQKVIVAPPQMAGPNELAARAKEAAAAAVSAKSKATDDDDDVTRALLAAAAGVTYTRVQGPNGKEKVVASITKPPLTPVAKPPEQKPNVSEPVPVLDANKINQMILLPPPGPSAYRSISTNTNVSGHKKKRYIRVAAGATWEDPTLADWDPNDFRMFCGDLGNEVTDDTLARAFNRYPSFQRARVIRDKRTSKSRGYGFVSFSDPEDFTRAMREMNGKYVGNRPIKLKRSDWRSRQLEVHRKREKERKKLGLKN